MSFIIPKKTKRERETMSVYETFVWQKGLVIFIMYLLMSRFKYFPFGSCYSTFLYISNIYLYIGKNIEFTILITFRYFGRNQDLKPPKFYVSTTVPFMYKFHLEL